jgi:hypothetical protein
MNELMFLTSRTFEKKYGSTRIFFFPMLLVVVKIRIIIICYILHHIIITLCPKSHLYQSYFNMSCHGHIWLCHLIRVHVDMLTLLKRLLTKKQMSMQNVRMEKCLLHLACVNNYEGIILILCMILNLLFAFFLVS